MQDTFRPPARATMVARMERDGRITAWHARIAAPSAEAQVIARLRGEAGADGEAETAAVAGAVPPYSIPSVAVDHVPVQTGLRLGLWRSGAHSYTAFFTECFVDELARQAKMEPLSFRMQMLGDNPRLARVLSTAAALGGWDGGGPGSNMGPRRAQCLRIACGGAGRGRDRQGPEDQGRPAPSVSSIAAMS